jgi:hypothetical protein
MEVLRYDSGLAGFRYQAGALPLADSPATTGEGDGPDRSGRKSPR